MKPKLSRHSTKRKWAEVIDLCSDEDEEANEKIDSDSTVSQDVRIENTQSHNVEKLCLICSKNFQGYSIELQEKHINQCLDEQARKIDHIQRHTYQCKICDTFFFVSEEILVSQRHISARLQHIKQCANSHGIEGPIDLKLYQQYDKPLTSKDSLGFADIFNMPSVTASQSLPELVLDIKEEGHLLELASEIETKPDTVNTYLMHGEKYNKKNRKVDPNKTTSKCTVPKTKSKPNPPLYRRIIGSEFVVDGFKYHSKKFYFLTHFHSDHYGGISQKGTKSKLIVCTRATANLVKLMFNIDEKAFITIEYFQMLKIKNFRITCLPANHCPGAAMFYFRNTKTSHGTLHTGDFRYDQGEIALEKLHLGMIRSNGQKNGLFPITTVYLDTTFCFKDRDFIPQKEAIAQALRLVERYGKQHTTLLLFGTYGIGKEKVFVRVIDRLTSSDTNIKIGCSKKKLSMLGCVNLNSIYPNFDKRFELTSERSGTRFQVVQMQELKLPKLMEFLINFNKQFNQKFRRIIGIRATGWIKHPSIRHHDSQTATLVSVPYSEHSSFLELKKFVKDINIRQRQKVRLIPTVKTKQENLAEIMRT